MSLSHRLKKRLEVFFKQIQDDPLLGIANIIATMLAIIGTVQSFEWTMNSSRPILFGTFFSITLIALILVYVFRPPAVRLFHLTRTDRVETLTQNLTLTISSDGIGWLLFDQNVIFRGEPNPDDLRDKLHCNAEMDFSDLQYSSPDSTPIRILREDNDLIAVYFTPNTPPQPYTPFAHAFSFKIPETIGPNYYCVRPAINVPMGKYTVVVASSMPIEKVICFKEPAWLSTRAYTKLALYSLKLTDSRCPPAFDLSDAGFKWSISNPEVGRIYNCMFFFKGRTREFMNTHSWRARFTAQWVRLKKVIYLRRQNERIIGGTTTLLSLEGIIVVARRFLVRVCNQS